MLSTTSAFAPSVLFCSQKYLVWSGLVWSGRVKSVLKGLVQFGTLKPKCWTASLVGISQTTLTSRSPDGDNINIVNIIDAQHQIILQKK